MFYQLCIQFFFLAPTFQPQAAPFPSQIEGQHQAPPQNHANNQQNDQVSQQNYQNWNGNNYFNYVSHQRD